VKGTDVIRSWRQDVILGRKKLFKLDKTKLINGTKILAFADIFTALREDRPYIAGYDVKILRKNVENNKMDEKIINLLIDNYENYNRLRDKKQQKVTADYKAFKNNTSDEIDNIFHDKPEYINI